MNRNILPIGVAVLTAGLTAVAATPQNNDSSTILQAKISLAQAVAAAEQSASGRASKAEFEQSRAGRWGYDIEVVSGVKVFDVRVDAKSGSVVTDKEDAADRDDKD